MTITAGVISLISAGSNTSQLSATAATSGTPPYTQQWYRSTIGSGFIPGPSYLITGATGLSLNDTNLIPNTQYWYKLVYTDSTSATAISAAFLVMTLPASQGMNQFAMTATLGMIDLKSGSQNLVSVQIDTSQLTPLYAGQPIKFFNSPYGIPTVIAAGTSMPNGYIVYDQKSSSFQAGDRCEIARTLSCMWLYATTAIARGSMVILDPDVASGVQQITGSSTLPIVGEAFDQAVGAGQLIRVILNVPSNMIDNDSSVPALMPTQQILTGTGIYIPTVSAKPILYCRLRLAGGGGGASGSATGGDTGGDGIQGGDSSFADGAFIARGGGGGTFTEGGIGGICDVTAVAEGVSYKGQNGMINQGIFFGATFNTAPNNLNPFILGGAGGNSLFAGAGQSYHELDAVEDTGCGGGGPSIQADSTLATTWNGGTGGGGGGWLDYIIAPGEFNFVIGAGGAGGAAGTGPRSAAGGKGANGIGIITEYYQ